MNTYSHTSESAGRRWDWPLWGAWVLSAILLAVGLDLLNQSAGFLVQALGAVQALLLWRRLPRGGYWLAVTVVGFGLAILLWDGVFNQLMQFGQLFPAVRDYPLVNEQVSMAVSSGFDWAVIAAAQWLVLLRRGLAGLGKRHAAGWIAANALGGLLYGAVLGRYTMPPPNMDWLVALSDRHILPLPVVTSAINAVAAAGYALPSATALVWLLRHPLKARAGGGATFTIGRVTLSIAGK